jgi:hypothetical protein
MSIVASEAATELAERIAAELASPVPGGATALAGAIRARHGDAVRGVLFYGSCLRRNDDREGVLDLYVLVDDYRRAYGTGAYGSGLLAAVNALLPPNVFYIETRHGGRTVRAKYAVLSLADLARATSARTFEPYFWARFAQPCALVYAAGPEVTRSVVDALADAVRTFVRAGLPLAPERFDASELWTAMLRETYRCEVRAERSGAADALVRFAPDRYAAVTRLALAGLPVAARTGPDEAEGRFRAELSPRDRRLGRVLWRLRRAVGKTLFLLRLLRNALIFEGGVDYIIWKVERHSGSTVDPSWRESRFRLFALGAEVVRQYRRGAFR